VTELRTQGELKKALRSAALLAVAMGSVASQSSFVSVLNGAGIGGGAFLAAILIAFLLTLCYAFAFLELALIMPRAGGLSTYTAIRQLSLSHKPSLRFVPGRIAAVLR